jgi:hypothetical protein
MAEIILALVILALLIERHFFAKEMNERVSQAVKAVMSRNINEYIAATQAEKPNTDKFTENEEVSISDATDEEFERHIQSQTK